MKDYITLKELEAKENELIAEYNEYTAKGWNVFAEHAIESLKAVRYVMTLIDGKAR
jgi:archaeosine-15-forming tRNA-guanine transglycosylase